MKKIAIIAAAMLLSQGAIFAQKAINEQDVKVSYVKDFQRQVKDAKDIAWFQIDENSFKVTYRDNEDSRQAMVFSNKGMETHYFIEDHYPQSIVDYVKDNYKGFKVTDLWARKARNKMTYQARIAKKSGFLFWKKEREAKVLNFEINGKFISEE